MIPNSDTSSTSRGASTNGSGTSSGRTPVLSTSASLRHPHKVPAGEAHQMPKPTATRERSRRTRQGPMRVMVSQMKAETELFKQLVDHPIFEAWCATSVFGAIIGNAADFTDWFVDSVLRFTIEKIAFPATLIGCSLRLIPCEPTRLLDVYATTRVRRHMSPWCSGTAKVLANWRHALRA